MIHIWMSDITGIKRNYIFYNYNTKLINKKEIDIMMLCGIYESEKIMVHPNDAPHTSHYVEITKDKDNPMFYVTSCCDEEWNWTFVYSKTNYELVKYTIMDLVMLCDTMDELIDALNDVFEEEFTEMTFNEAELQEEEVEWECDGDCENCSFNEDKYLN